MPSTEKKPLVSIVIPVFNDEQYIARALGTAINQSLSNIEIICVDDKSTDNTVDIIEKHIAKDSRVALIRQGVNQSAFQARLAGIKAAKASYILFLDGDDELHKDAAKLSYLQAKKSTSDIVGFGSRIIRKDGSSSRDFENSAQPLYRKLNGAEIVGKLFEPNRPVQGSLWRFLFSKQLLLDAYSFFPENSRFYRTNDLPITFLCAALSKQYTSIKNKLYTYHYYAGGSGSANFDIDKFKFYVKALESMDQLQTIVEKEEFSDAVKESYFSTRLFVISNIVRQIENNLPITYHQQAFDYLLSQVNATEVISSIATYMPEALTTYRNTVAAKRNTTNSKNIALFTNNLHTGGVQGVVISQAAYLRDAGFKVCIFLLTDTKIAFEIPAGVEVSVLEKGPIYIRLRSLASLIRNKNIDTLIDHSILYNFSWPFFHLTAKSHGVKNIAWIHSFALRPLTESSTLGKFLIENIRLIDDLVVLSKADVSYWKSIGHNNVYFLPNPPSPLLLENRETIAAKVAPEKHLNIIWFGRLQQATKKVVSLVDIAVELKKLTDDFTLTIIGPAGNDLTIQELKDIVRSRNISDNVKVVGPKHGTELINELKKADLYLNTSIIEGYLLTLIEAQSYGLPAVMYELPWIATVQNNQGVVQTPQNNPAAAALEINRLFTDKAAYEEMSHASLAAVKSQLSFDLPGLYQKLLQGELPKSFSPNPDINDMGLFMKWTHVLFAELVNGGALLNEPEALRQKNAEIHALKNSKAMKVGNLVAGPLRTTKTVKHRASRYIKKRWLR